MNTSTKNAIPMNPAHESLEDSIGFLVGRLKSVMLAELDEALKGFDITSAQWIILMKIANGCGRTGAELCRGMHYDTGSMTRMLDRLEEKGLVVRHRSAEDRRVIELVLSEQGAKLYPQLYAARQGLGEKMLMGFAGEEVTQFKAMIRRMLANLSGEAQP